jgi:hypothetical protein
LVRKKEAMSLSVRGTFSLEKEKASVFIIVHIGNFLFSAILFDDVKESFDAMYPAEKSSCLKV